MTKLYIYKGIVKRAVCWVILVTFSMSSFVLPAQAQAQNILNFPPALLALTPGYVPAFLKGVVVHPENPFKFDFIVDPGHSQLKDQGLKDETKKLVRYFLATITVPEDDQWVNLSPYEKDRIVPEAFGQTEMGRDLLAQDYILKQLTASLMYPEGKVGKEFWERIRKLAAERFGINEIPVNTFNKVWIVPQQASVYEDGNVAIVTHAKLKVMLEEDYVAAAHQRAAPTSRAPARDRLVSENTAKETRDDFNSRELSNQIIREIIVPALEIEVNEGKHFAPLRQIYYSMILASWYKDKLKNSILNQVYANKNKIAGVNTDDPLVKLKIYNQYVEAFKKGTYDYIKDEYDPSTQTIIPRRYFAGGFEGKDVGKIRVVDTDLSPEEAASIGKNVLVSIEAENSKEQGNNNQAVSEFRSAVTTQVLGNLLTEKSLYKLLDQLFGAIELTGSEGRRYQLRRKSLGYYEVVFNGNKVGTFELMDRKIEVVNGKLNLVLEQNAFIDNEQESSDGINHQGQGLSTQLVDILKEIFTGSEVELRSFVENFITLYQLNKLLPQEQQSAAAEILAKYKTLAEVPTTRKLSDDQLKDKWALKQNILSALRAGTKTPSDKLQTTVIGSNLAHFSEVISIQISVKDEIDEILMTAKLDGQPDVNNQEVDESMISQSVGVWRDVFEQKLFNRKDFVQSKHVWDALKVLLYQIVKEKDSAFDRPILKSREEFIELGNYLRQRWSENGWNEKFGRLNQYLPLLEQEFEPDMDLMRIVSGHVDELMQGDLEDRAIGLWSRGVLISYHLRKFGLHLDDGIKPSPPGEFFDQNLLIKTVKETIAKIVELNQSNRLDQTLAPPLQYQGNQEYQLRPLMLWGLVMMLDPMVHNFMLAQIKPQETIFSALQKWPEGPEQAMRETILEMLSDISVNEDGQMRLLRDEEIENVLLEAFSMTAKKWNEAGLRLPQNASIYNQQFRANVLTDNFPYSESSFPTADLMFALAYDEAVFQLNDESLLYFPREDMVYPNGADVYSFFARGGVGQKFPRVRELLSSRNDYQRHQEAFDQFITQIPRSINVNDLPDQYVKKIISNWVNNKWLQIKEGGTNRFTTMEVAQGFGFSVYRVNEVLEKIDGVVHLGESNEVWTIAAGPGAAGSFEINDEGQESLLKSTDTSFEALSKEGLSESSIQKAQEPWFVAGHKSELYHGLDHSRDVAAAVYLLAKGLGLKDQAEFLYQVWLLHDFDQGREIDTPARASVTIELIRQDMEGELSLDGIKGKSLLIDKWNWSKLQCLQAMAFIARSQFPFENESTQPYKDLLQQIKEIDKDAAEFVARYAPLFSEFTDKANAPIIGGFLFVKSTVENLVAEINEVNRLADKEKKEDEKKKPIDPRQFIVANYEYFWKSIGQPKYLEEDQKIAQDFGLNIGAPLYLDEALSKFPQSFQLRYRANMAAFQKLAEVYGSTRSARSPLDQSIVDQKLQTSESSFDEALAAAHTAYLDAYENYQVFSDGDSSNGLLEKRRMPLEEFIPIPNISLEELEAEAEDGMNDELSHRMDVWIIDQINTLLAEEGVQSPYYEINSVDIKTIWGLIVENIMQHEKKEIDGLYLRIYLAKEPAFGIRVEFWGEGRTPLPEVLTAKKWFTLKQAPWRGAAPFEARELGVGSHMGIENIWERLAAINNPTHFLRIGWSNNDQNLGPAPGGHIIAMHIPVEKKESPQQKESTSSPGAAMSEELITWLSEQRYLDSTNPLTESMIQNLHAHLVSEGETVDLIHRGELSFQRTSAPIPGGVYRTDNVQSIKVTSPDKISEEMKEFITWMNQEEKSLASEKIEEFVAESFIRFIQIHPFEDGNGRMSRQFINLLLLRHNRPTINLNLLDWHNDVLLFKGFLKEDTKYLTFLIRKAQEGEDTRGYHRYSYIEGKRDLVSFETLEKEKTISEVDFFNTMSDFIGRDFPELSELELVVLKAGLSEDQYQEFLKILSVGKENATNPDTEEDIQNLISYFSSNGRSGAAGVENAAAGLRIDIENLEKLIYESSDSLGTIEGKLSYEGHEFRFVGRGWNNDIFENGNSVIRVFREMLNPTQVRGSFGGEMERKLVYLKKTAELGITPKVISTGYLPVEDNRLHHYIEMEKVEGKSFDQLDRALTDEEIQETISKLDLLFSNQMMVDDLFNIGNLLIGRIGNQDESVYLVDIDLLRTSNDLTEDIIRLGQRYAAVNFKWKPLDPEGRILKYLDDLYNGKRKPGDFNKVKIDKLKKVPVELGSQKSEVGGIDLKRSGFDIDVKGNQGVPAVDFDPKDWEGIEIEGLTPVIINMIPLPSLLPLLSSQKEPSKEELVQL